MLIKSNNTSVIPKHQHMKIINRNGPLEIITLVYDTALDRWTGEEWFGRLKKQRETLVLGHGTLLLGPSGFAGKEFWAAAEYRLRRPLPARHAGGLQGCAISAYKLLPFRPPSISFPSRSSLQARPGDDGPPCSCRDLLHIISYHFVLWDASSCLIRRPRGKHRADSVPQPTGPFRPPPPSMGAPPRTVKRTSRPGLSFTARPHGGVQVHSGRLDGCSTVLL